MSDDAGSVTKRICELRDGKNVDAATKAIFEGRFSDLSSRDGLFRLLVAIAAREGLTDLEIAQRIHRGVRTVERKLSVIRAAWGLPDENDEDTREPA